MSANEQTLDDPGRPAPPPLPFVKEYYRRLSELLGSWRRGLLTCALLRIGTVLLVALAAYALADYFLALDNSTRKILGGILIGGVALSILWQVISVSQLRRQDIARRSDTISGIRRKPVLSALELLGEGSTGSDLSSYLVSRSVHEANNSLSGLTKKSVYPSAEFKRLASRFLIVALCCVVGAVIFFPAVKVLSQRIAKPWEDIPPYSPLVFTVDPTTPEIFYGDDTTINVEITGGELTEPVRFLTRDGDDIFETVCFRDGPNRFAQKLERVVSPTQFAFAHGKARSAWHDIDLLLEPKVAIASVTVTPPAYTGLAENTFLIGEKPFAALKGSRVKLSVTSNRPLLNGEATIHPTGSPQGTPGGVEGIKSDTSTVTFEWTVREEASVEIQIRDIRGTPNRDPFLISQRVIPDQPPEIDMKEPPLHMMATPSIKVPIKATAEDDLGLNRVELVRTVVGYRDRMERVGPAMTERRFEFDNRMDLSTLGVQPGETLELYFQAADRNPSLLGIDASEVARIQIISDEEYANIIRTRTTIKEFADRFRVVNESLRDLREALKKLEEARASGDKAAEEQARQQAEAAAKRAAELFDLLSNDFAAFDLEKGAIENATETLEDLQSIQEQLGQEALSDEQLQQMMDQIGARQQEAEKQQKTAEEIAAVARVMEQAAEFSRIVMEQETLTRRLKQFETETRSSDVPFLEALGQDQDKLKERLEKFAENLEQRLDDLPPQYQDLAEGAKKFLEALDQAKADTDMETSTEAAGNEDGSRSFQYSSLALEKLQDLLEGESGSGAGSFQSLCQGSIKFPLPQGLQSTLSQMLSAIGLRSGSGAGSPSPGSGRSGQGGGGVGSGGDSEDGYSMAGYTALDIPVVGPPRMRLEYSPEAQLGDDDSESGPQGQAPLNEVSEAERFESGNRDAPTAAPIDFDLVPEKYRDAVKRYFTHEEKNQPNPGKK